MQKLDCFFFLEGLEEEGDKRIMRACCVDCMKEKRPDKAMFWPGSEKGYGPYKYSCIFCKKVIYDHGEK